MFEILSRDYKNCIYKYFYYYSFFFYKYIKVYIGIQAVESNRR